MTDSVCVHALMYVCTVKGCTVRGEREVVGRTVREVENLKGEIIRRAVETVERQNE